MTLAIIAETPTSIIVTGPGAELMNALLTPAMAQYAVQAATLALHAALQRVDAEAEMEPEAWAVAACPAFWTREARIERWRWECASVCRCWAAIDNARDQLLRMEMPGRELTMAAE